MVFYGKIFISGEEISIRPPPLFSPQRNPSSTLPHQPETVDYSKLNLSHWNPRLSEDLLSTTRERSEIKDCTLHRVTNPPL